MKRLVVVHLLALGLAFSPQPGHASGPSAEEEMAAGEREFAEAEQLLLAGESARAAEKLRSASEHFRGARELAPEATGPMLGLGLTLAGMGRCEDALRYLTVYLEKKATESNPNAISAQEKCLVSTGVGGYVSFSSSDGAVSVVLRPTKAGSSAVYLGLTPTTTRFLEEGKYQVTFSQGDRVVTRDFALRGGESLLLEADLAPYLPLRNSRFRRRFWWGGVGLLLGAGLGVGISLAATQGE